MSPTCHSAAQQRIGSIYQCRLVAHLSSQHRVLEVGAEGLDVGDAALVREIELVVLGVSEWRLDQLIEHLPVSALSCSSEPTHCCWQCLLDRHHHIDLVCSIECHRVLLLVLPARPSLVHTVRCDSSARFMSTNCTELAAGA